MNDVIDVSPVKILILIFFSITTIKKAHSPSISNLYDARVTNTAPNTIWNNIVQAKYSIRVSDHSHFFYFGFTALSRIFHLYRADHSSKVGENRRTRGETTWPSVSRTWLFHMWPEWGSNHSGEKPNGLRVNSPIHYAKGPWSFAKRI